MYHLKENKILELSFNFALPQNCDMEKIKHNLKSQNYPIHALSH